MKRLAFNLAAAMALLLFLATITFWILSYFSAMTLMVRVGPQYALRSPTPGTLCYEQMGEPPSSRASSIQPTFEFITRRWGSPIYTAPRSILGKVQIGTVQPVAEPWIHRGFGIYFANYGIGQTCVAVAAPFWCHALLLLAIVLWWFRQFKRRSNPGLCPTCGYDLRATPNRCPECGTARLDRIASADSKLPRQ